MTRYLSQIKTILVVLFLVCLKPLVAQNSFKSFFKNYSVNQGLPSSQVYEIIQDRFGYIWFGTDRGLVRYNGYEFEVFTVDDGLSSNVIFHLVEGPNDELWLYGKDRKVHYYSNGSFHEFEHNHVLKENITNKANLLNFEVKPGKLIFYLWDMVGSNYYLEVMRDGHHTSRSDKEGIFILENSDGIKVCHNTPGLSEVYFNDRLIFSLPELVKVQHMNFSNVTRFNDLIYLSVGNYLLRLTEHNGEFDYTIIHILDEGILDMIIDEKGDLILGTNGGMYKVHTSQDDRLEILKSTEAISSVHIDQNGGVWASSLFNGLFYCNDMSTKHLFGEENRIIDFYRSNNRFFYTTKSGDFFGIEGNEGVPLKLSEKQIPEGGSHSNETCVIFPSKLGSCSFLVDTTTNEFWRVKVNADAFVTVPTGYVVQNNEMFKFLLPNFEVKSNSRVDGYLNCFIRLSPPTRMLGLDDGVKLFEATDKTFLGYKENGELIWQTNTRPYRPEVPFFRTRINDIIKIEDSLIIYASGQSGLYIEKMDGDDIILTRTEGLISNMLDKVSFENGLIVVTSKEGVSVINEDMTITNYTIGNHLLSNDVNNAYTHNDTIWVATDLGISKLALASPNVSDPLLYLTSVEVNGVLKDIQSEYNLHHDQQSIVISFEALSYWQEGNVSYRYRLDGLEEDWVYTKNRNVRYPNLPAGEFDFYLSVERGDKSWTAPKKLFSIKKSKPYWELWWFRLAAALLILGGLAFITYRIIQRQKRIQQEKFRVLNLERKTLQAQMNPHFIFNSLTSLQNLIIKDKKKESQKYLSKFAWLARLALNHSTKNYIPLQEEIELLTNYVDLEKIRFSDSFDYVIEQKLDNVQGILIPPLLIQPFVENAILHGLAEKKEGGMLTIVFSEKDGNSLLCTIRDNGVGRSKENKNPERKSLGIRLIRERLKILSGDGAVKIVDIIEDDQPLGTEVLVVLPFKQNLP